MHNEQQLEQDAEWRAWAAKQLTDAGWDSDDERQTRYIIDQFLGMGVVATHRGLLEFAQAVDIVVELLSSRALKEEEHWSDSKKAELRESNAVWMRVQPGQTLNLQDRVRVMNDAYSDGSAYVHNGAVGTVIGVRYGKAVVHYDGAPPGTGHHHDIRLLEKKVIPVR